MTVRELIVQLMAQPQNATVVVNAGKNELANGRLVQFVRFTPTFIRKEDGWEYHAINYYPSEPPFENEVPSEAVNITS